MCAETAEGHAVGRCFLRGGAVRGGGADCGGRGSSRRAGQFAAGQTRSGKGGVFVRGSRLLRRREKAKKTERIFREGVDRKNI